MVVVAESSKIAFFLMILSWLGVGGEAKQQEAKIVVLARCSEKVEPVSERQGGNLREPRSVLLTLPQSAHACYVKYFDIRQANIL